MMDAHHEIAVKVTNPTLMALKRALEVAALAGNDGGLVFEAMKKITKAALNNEPECVLKRKVEGSEL